MEGKFQRKEVNHMAVANLILAVICLVMGILGIWAGGDILISVLYLIGFPFFLNRYKKRRNYKTKTVTRKVLKENPHIQYWVCHGCKAKNYMDKTICPVCGVTKQWSDDQKK